MTTVSETISGQPRPHTRYSTWADFIERLAFGLLLLLALTFAFEAPLGTSVAGEAALTTDKILQAAVIGLWIIAHGLNRTWPKTPRRLIVPICVWLAVLLVTTALAPAYFSHTIRFLSRIIQGLLLAWIAYDLVNSPARWRMILCTLVAAGATVALLGWAEAARIPLVLKVLQFFRDSQTHVGDVVRISSSLEYATIAAMVLEMLIPLTTAWIVTAQSRWLKAILVIVLAIDVSAMVLTLTRSALMGLVTALIVVMLVSLSRRRRDNALVAGGTIGMVLVCVTALLTLNPTVGLRLLSESENGWYQARYLAPTEVTAHPNELVTIPIQLTNAGLHVWSPQANPPFRLGVSLSRPDDKSFKALDGPRTELPGDVAPGQSIAVNVQIPAPATTGEYLLQWDMVEETVLWFSWRGSSLGSTRLIVAGEPVVGTRRLALPPANHTTAAPPVERPVLWGAALHMFRDKPLFGVGPDNFRWIYGNYLKLDHWDTNIHANSIYLEWLADTGLIGLLAFLWLNWRWLRTAWQGLNQQTNPKLWIWQLALLASLITWFVHGFLDYFYEFAGTYILFWLIAGLAINASLYPARNAAESTR